MENIPVIKPITIDDVALLQSVALEAYRGHYLHLWYDAGEWYMAQSFSIRQLSTEVEDSNAQFFMVYDAGKAVGFVKININAPLGDEENALELERIYFIKEAAGKGLGSFAVNHVFDIAKSLHKKTVWLKVMDTSHAVLAFYKKMGFEICGTYVLPYEHMKEELRGMYIMQKTL